MATTTAVSGTSASNSAILQSYIDTQKAKTTATSTTTKSSASSVLSGDLNTFLKILTTQLQNQDPTAATDPNQFTQELVQFSGVEQQINTNAKLDKLISAANSNGITPLLSYVNQYVEAPANGQLVVQDSSSQFAYNLPSETAKVTIKITDSKGKEVTELNGATGSGLKRVVWDGKDSGGNTVSDGAYTMKLTATDSAGKTIDVSDIRLIGKVTSVQTGSDGSSLLYVGTVSLKDTDVDAVFSSATSS